MHPWQPARLVAAATVSTRTAPWCFSPGFRSVRTPHGTGPQPVGSLEWAFCGTVGGRTDLLDIDCSRSLASLDHPFFLNEEGREEVGVCAVSLLHRRLRAHDRNVADRILHSNVLREHVLSTPAHQSGRANRIVFVMASPHVFLETTVFHRPPDF